MTATPAEGPPPDRDLPAFRPVPVDPAAVKPCVVQAPIVATEQVGDRYWVLRLTATEVAAGSRPGQFVMISLGAPDESLITLPRPIAVYDTDPAAGTVDLCIGVVGPGTKRLAGLEPGDVATVVGPLGRSFPLPNGGGRLLLVGRGIGVCSLTDLARAARGRGVDVTAVVSGRKPSALIGVDVLERHGVDPVVTVIDEDGSSAVGALAADLERRVGDDPPSVVATCGSERLLQLSSRLAAGWGARLYTSVEEHMACGLGYCHSCALPSVALGREGPLVCADGPVFQVDTGRP
jgi:dihydroorotate dehydrogenase electron transfer subunit